MRNLKTKALALLIVPILLLQSGCTVSQQATALAAAQIAVEGIITGLTIAGQIPPAYAPEIQAWASDATVAFGLTATELASSDTSAVKSLKISGYWAATIQAFTSLPGPAQAYITLAESLIQAFLNLVAPAGAVAHANGTVSYHGQFIPAVVRLGPGVDFKLKHIVSQSVSDLKTLATIKR